MQLETVTITAGITGTKKARANRQGYQDENGQTYLPPSNEKKKSFWILKMQKKGYVFP